MWPHERWQPASNGTCIHERPLRRPHKGAVVGAHAQCQRGRRPNQRGRTVPLSFVSDSAFALLHATICDLLGAEIRSSENNGSSSLSLRGGGVLVSVLYVAIQRVLQGSKPR